MSNQLLQQAGVQVQQVQPKQQSADVRLSSDATRFAQTHGNTGCLVVVTKDTGVCGHMHVLALMKVVG